MYVSFYDTAPTAIYTLSLHDALPILNDPGINRAMDQAALVADLKQRRQAWGDIDRRVTATAAAIPWLWDKTPNITSRDVVGVIAKWNASFQPSFCSLKR